MKIQYRKAQFRNPTRPQFQYQYPTGLAPVPPPLCAGDEGSAHPFDDRVRYPPPLSLRLSASPNARPIPGIPVVRRPSRRLRRRAVPLPTAPAVAPVVTVFAYAKPAPILTPFPFSPVPGLRAALWAPRDWPCLRLGACHYVPGGGGHFALRNTTSIHTCAFCLRKIRRWPQSGPASFQCQYKNPNAESQCGNPYQGNPILKAQIGLSHLCKKVK